METNRTKNSILNLIAMIINTAITSILALVSTNLILKNYGSDFNGVVATANQFVNLLLIIEGGFTTAINVALYKPFIDGDSKKINAIMSAAKKTFFKIGTIFLFLGVLISVIYPIVIKSELPYITILLIFLMVMIGSAYNLTFVIRSQIMFQVSQREYIYTIFSIIVNILSNLTTIILAYNKVNMLLIRFSILFFIILNGIMIYIAFKKIFKNIDTNVEPDYKSIKGTKDLIVQKLTSVLYLSSPLLFISTFISTAMGSIYAVYSSIYNIIKSLLTSVNSAPVNGFGQLLSKGKNKEVYDKFKLYEYIIIVLSTILMASVLGVIIPFIKIYTADLKDINYSNWGIAILLAMISFLEVIHIPSGNVINVTGNFKVARKIQSLASVLIIVLLFMGGYFFGIYGVLAANLITNIVLAALEIWYAHTKIFESNVSNYLFKFFWNLFLIFGLVYIVNLFSENIDSYIKFFMFGGIVVVINSIVIMFANFIFFGKEIKSMFSIVFNFLKRKKLSL